MIVLKSRSLIVPNDEYNLGNDYDTNTATRVFQLDRIMEGIDLGNLMFKLDLTYADGTDDTLALDSEVTDDKINLTWTVTKNQLHVPGTVVVQIRALNVDGNMKWTSNIGAFFVEASLFGSADYTGKLSEIEQFEAAISSEKERVQNEKKRQDAEAEREKAETARKSTETERAEAEAVRKSAETEREKAEAERKSAEDKREEWYDSAKSNFDAAVESGNKAERIANALTKTVDADMKAAASSATAAAGSASAAAGSANEAKQYSQNWSSLDERVKKNATAIETTNNNLSNPDRINLNVLIEKTSLNSPERTGVYYVTGDNIGALPSGFSNYGILLCMRSPYSLHPTNSNCVYVQEYTDVYGKHASRSSNNGAWTNWTTTATKDDLLISVSGTGPTDWTALETTGNMPFKIWNVTKASTSKGAPAGCYEYGTLIALVATATGDRWRNTLIYIPDSNSDSKIYIRNGRATKWLAFSGTKVDSVS